MKRMILIIAILLLAAFGSYTGLKYYYTEHFGFQTFVNGVYITGQTIESANQLLLEGDDYGSLLLVQEERQVGEIILKDIHYQLSFIQDLNLLLSTQRQNSGANILQTGQQLTILPDISYDSELLEDSILALSFVQENKTETDRKFEIKKTLEGYQLLDETRGVLNREQLIETVKEALEKGETKVSIENCFYDLAKTSDMKKTEELYEKISAFQNFHITYQLSDTIWELTPSVVSEWITLDENNQFALDEQGNLILNEQKVKEYIDQLGDTFDTYQRTRSFQATRGETVTIEGGTYGNLMNREAEYEFLLTAFQNKVNTTRVPEFIKKAKYQGIDDIGNTYIEIDMTNQLLYYYLNGECFLQTDIVTGNVARNMETPARVCYVYAKQRNRTLRGPGYAAFVNYWMPVNGNIGIHDAKWRDEFGGDIYLTQGSHGCINTPYDSMKILYENVEIGTPVVMFY